jgi:hypothetical protein
MRYGTATRANRSPTTAGGTRSLRLVNGRGDATLFRNMDRNRQEQESCAQLRIPTMPISRSSGSRSVIPIDPDQRGVSAPLDAFLISVFGPNVKHG